MVFHCPSGFSELSVRLIILLPLPSVMPQFSLGPRRFSISGTVISSSDAPEVTSIVMLHLCLYGFWKHFIQCSWRRCMYEHTAITWFTRKAILHYQPVILVYCIRNKMTLRSTKTYQHSIAYDKWINGFCISIHFGNIYMPAAEVFAIKKTFCLCRTNQRKLHEEGYYGKYFCLVLHQSVVYKQFKVR